MKTPIKTNGALNVLNHSHVQCNSLQLGKLTALEFARGTRVQKKKYNELIHIVNSVPRVLFCFGKGTFIKEQQSTTFVIQPRCIGEDLYCFFFLRLACHSFPFYSSYGCLSKLNVQSNLHALATCLSHGSGSTKEEVLHWGGRGARHAWCTLQMFATQGVGGLQYLYKNQKQVQSHGVKLKHC